MGPKNACSHADIAMGEIDHKAKHCGPIKPLHWWRYRDDIIDLWQQGLAALNSFTEYINSLYPTIKFELVYSEYKLYVLEVWGGSRGGSGGSVEPPKLNVKMYNKRVVKKK